MIGAADLVARLRPVACSRARLLDSIWSGPIGRVGSMPTFADILYGISVIREPGQRLREGVLVPRLPRLCLLPT